MSGMGEVRAVSGKAPVGQPARITVAKYLRISNEDTDRNQAAKTESDSIANQRDLLSDFISRMSEFDGADIIEFCDDGWSGKNFTRPAVQEMLGMACEGKIQCIVVKDMSRFGRDYLEVGNYISRVFPFLGIRFIAVNDGYDSIRPADTDSLETSFKTLLYDLYSRDLSKKVRSAKKRKAENGEFLSPFAPYGYVKDTERKNHLIIDEEAAGNVRRIFQMAADGQTTEQIARELNIEHVPTPMKQKRREGCRREWKSICWDNFWTRNAVGVILRDERYIGTNIYGKRVRDEVGKSHTVKNRREDWTAVENAHEGIVSRSEFERAQEAMRKFTEHPCSPSGRPFNKKIRCGICGHIMARIGRKNPYYICRTPSVTDAYACPTGRMPEKDFMDVLKAQLHAQALYALDTSRIWEEKHRREKQDVKSIQKSISILRETYTALERHIRELYEKNIFGEIDKETYLKEKNAAAEKRDSIRAEIDALEAKLQNARADGKLENKFVDSFSKYAEIDKLTAEIVSDVLQEIIVYPGGRFHIVWNYGDELERLLLDINMEDKAENAED